MADIFISYAREDRQWVEKLANQLQSEGFTVWWDWDLLVGKRYRETIDTELQTCKTAVVVWSQHSVQSDFVRDEAEEAQQRNILVPVLKEVVRPPAGFRQIQTADLSTWTGSGDHAEFRRVMKGIAHMVGRTARGDTGEIAVDPVHPTVQFEPEPAPPEPAPPPKPVRQAESSPTPITKPSPAPAASSIAPTILANIPPKNHPIWRYVAFGAVALLAVLFVIGEYASISPTPKPTTPATPAAGPTVPPSPAPNANPTPPVDNGETGDIAQPGPRAAAGSTGGHTGNDNSDTSGNAGNTGDTGDIGQGTAH